MVNFTFIPLQESHFPLLLKWFQAPHVKAWWDHDMKWTPALIKEKYGSYVKGFKRLDFSKQIIEKPLHAFIIGVDRQEIGYIQYYNAYDFPREDKVSLEDLPKSLAALDFFIGETNYLGKGLGSEGLKQFLKNYIDLAYEACFVDPNTENARAIQCYEKAGFKKVKSIKGGTITWMIKEKRPKTSVTL